MRTRPTPTGYQHYLKVRLRRAPEPRFTDPLAALGDMETGLEQPIVEVIEEHVDGSVLVRVSVLGDSAEPSRDAAAAIEGLAAELRYADST